MKRYFIDIIDILVDVYIANHQTALSSYVLEDLYDTI